MAQRKLEGAVTSVLVRARNGCSKFVFGKFISFLTSRGVPLGAKGRLYSECVCSVVLYGSKTWSVTKVNVEDNIWKN